MNLDLEKIGQFIQAGRKAMGITQAEMAERLHVSTQSVSNWERGETLPDVSMLPDLANTLQCSIDSLLSGGEGSGCYRRRVFVEQTREALGAIDRIGELLGRNHFIYQCIIEALDQRMNTKIEQAFSDPHLFDVFTIELLLECIKNGDYVDLRDVKDHLPPSKARDYLLQRMKDTGIC